MNNTLKIATKLINPTDTHCASKEECISDKYVRNSTSVLNQQTDPILTTANNSNNWLYTLSNHQLINPDEFKINFNNPIYKLPTWDYI